LLLKGLRRVDQQSLVDQYNASASDEDRVVLPREEESGLKKLFATIGGAGKR